MMRIKLWLVMASTILCTCAFAQQPAGLEGLVTDQVTGRPVRGVKVTIEQWGKVIDSAQTNDSGFYRISNVEPGSYKLKLFHFSYEKVVVTFIDIEMQTLHRRDDMMRPIPLKHPIAR